MVRIVADEEYWIKNFAAINPQSIIVFMFIALPFIVIMNFPGS